MVIGDDRLNAARVRIVNSSMRGDPCITRQQNPRADSIYLLLK